MATKTVKVQDLSLDQLREQASSVDAHYADQDLQALQRRHDISVQQIEGAWVAGVGQVASELRSVATGASQEEAVLRSLVLEHKGVAVELSVAPTERKEEIRQTISFKCDVDKEIRATFIPVGQKIGFGRAPDPVVVPKVVLVMEHSGGDQAIEVLSASALAKLSGGLPFSPGRAPEYVLQKDDAARLCAWVQEQLAGPAMKIFEVTAAGFDAATDETDELVFWVAAMSAEVVQAAIQDTGATYCGEVCGCSLHDVDFTLPVQCLSLTSALLEKASDYRNRNREFAAVRGR